MQDPTNTFSALLTRIVALGVVLASMMSAQLTYAQKTAAGNQTAANDPQAKSQPKAADESNQEPPLFDMEAWAKQYRKYNTWEGGTGGIRLIDPTTGAPGSVRFQLLFTGFGAQDFISTHDEVQQVSETLSVSWTPLSILEIFGSYSNRGTESRFLTLTSANKEKTRQETYHVMGNALLGFKLGGNITGILNLGGDVNFILPNKEGSILPGFGAFGVRLRASANTDLRGLESPVPLIFRFNMGYVFDQSEELIENTEKNRYSNLSDPLKKKYETRHLVSRIERFTLNINRVDFFSLGLGAEVPMIRLVDSFYLHPLLEWSIGIPVNRRGFTCASRKTEDGKAASVAGMPKSYVDDKCLKDEGIGVIPMTLEIGTRVITPIRGLTALAAVSFGLTGTSNFVREIAPLPPYQLLGALAYDYDARPPEADIKIVERRVKVAPPPTGRIVGLVTVEGTATPVAGAAVKFADGALSSIMTRADGRFVSYEFGPGEIPIEVTHPEFNNGQCSATITDNGGDANVMCALSPLPNEAPLTGRVIDNWSIPVANAGVFLSSGGASSYKLTTGQDGRFDQKVTPGQYSVRVESAGHLERTDSFTIAPRSAATIEISVVAKSIENKVSQKGNVIRLGGNLSFERGSSKLQPKGAVLLADLTDYLQRNPQIRQIKIEGSVDSGSKGTIAYDRAAAIKTQLVAYGIAPERIEAVAGKATQVKILAE
jgi:outer membrane protein OmpA-like peptidoglycan-associated protein